MIYESIEELIGKTPLMKLNGYMKKYGLKANLLVKLEYFNPTGSVKDRAAQYMLAEAKKSGLLKKDTVVIEPTSGNTGIGLAAMCAVNGLRLILTMPETMSVERRKLLAAFGAEIVLTDGAKGMSGAIEKAEEIHKQTPGSIIAGQFVNPANPKAHYCTTGPEIWEDTEGKADILVAGVGTGGTLSGTAKYLKEKKANIRAVAVEPDTSAVISGEKAGKHGLQGIGAGFIPEILDVSLIDETIRITDAQAFETSRDMAKTDGVFAGISAGAALYAAKILAEREENAGKNIVVIIPDTGMRYLSTDLFQA